MPTERRACATAGLRYGHLPEVEARLSLAEAMRLLDVPANFTREDIIAGLRRAVKKAHPDAGGTEELFRELVAARDLLLASIGSSAPAPKMPTFYPKGVKVVYRSGRRSSSTRRLAGPPRRLARSVGRGG